MENLDMEHTTLLLQKDLYKNDSILQIFLNTPDDIILNNSNSLSLFKKYLTHVKYYKSKDSNFMKLSDEANEKLMKIVKHQNAIEFVENHLNNLYM